MYRDRRFLAIIPARGGSKRLPQKNLLSLNGKPLVAYSIEAGLGSTYIDRVVLSSDDDMLLKIAKEYGVEALKRPAQLASDTATTFDTVKDVLQYYSSYDYIVLLQPTSPLRKDYHIDEAIELLEQKGADAVVSVCEMDHSPLWSNTLDETLSMEGFLDDEVLNRRSQELDAYYRLNGAIYICRVEKLLKEGSFLLKKSIYAYKMPREFSIDIDERIDFDIAELLMQKRSI